jgi:hypothetical protein
MAKPITNVPPGSVGEVVQAFVDNGESQVDASKQSNGLFTVTPGSAAPAASGGERSLERPKTPAATKRRAK